MRSQSSRALGSKLANLVRLTAARRIAWAPTWLTEPNQVRSLNLVREFRAAAGVGSDCRRHSETAPWLNIERRQVPRPEHGARQGEPGSRVSPCSLAACRSS